MARSSKGFAPKGAIAAFRACFLATLTLAISSAANAQDGSQKQLADYTLHDFAAKWMMQQDDIADIGFYAAENEALLHANDPRARIVLFGDSITYHWPAGLLTDSPNAFVVNRGVPGQNTSQMLLRFEDDVVALRPAIVVILAGTNDIRAHAGKPADLRDRVTRQAKRNITAMADIAKARNIAVILCTLPPVGPRQAGIYRDPETILGINAWLSDFSRERNLVLVDYHGALSDESGALSAEYSADDLHVNDAGYRAMSARLLPAIAASR